MRDFLSIIQNGLGHHIRFRSRNIPPMFTGYMI